MAKLTSFVMLMFALDFYVSHEKNFLFLIVTVYVTVIKIFVVIAPYGVKYISYACVINC